jgi:hypothetical protein
MLYISLDKNMIFFVSNLLGLHIEDWNSDISNGAVGLSRLEGEMLERLLCIYLCRRSYLLAQQA